MDPTPLKDRAKMIDACSYQHLIERRVRIAVLESLCSWTYSC